MIQSKALEINLARYHVDVTIDPRYAVLQDIMSKYYGLMDGFNAFLTELSHPYRNWQFIVRETRGYSLDYFHLLKNHPQGSHAAQLYVEIYLEALLAAGDKDVKRDAMDNLLLYLQKIIKEAGSQLEMFRPVLDECFNRFCEMEDRYFFLLVTSYYQPARLAESLLNQDLSDDNRLEALNRLLIKYYAYNYDLWLKEEDALDWFTIEAEDLSEQDDVLTLLEPISHRCIQQLHAKLHQIARKFPPASGACSQHLLKLTTFNQIVDEYRHLPRKLFNAGHSTLQKNRWKLIFLFHIMHLSGLTRIHEETLREINRTLSWLIRNEKQRNVRDLILKTFSILKDRTQKYPTTALACVLNMGRGIYQTDDSDLVNAFIDAVIDLGFQSPMIAGVSDDWQIKVNNAHIQNIRTWLELIELNPKWSTRLLSALIIHLSIGGVFIKDTDLFPRDITQLLNSNISSVYNLIKQLARLFPVYFNDIGAEGKLRDISTEIDEITGRKDVLIHFLRKQSHVESSNRIIGFIEATLNFWKTRDKKVIQAYVPPNIFEQIHTGGRFVDGMHRILTRLEQDGMTVPQDIRLLETNQLTSAVNQIRGISSDDRQRFILAAKLYKLIFQKYSLDFVEIDHYFAQLKLEAFPDLDQLKEAIKEPEIKLKLFRLLTYLERIKELTLDSKTYEVREDIYKKRHFAVDIPSMYGSYHEMKFNALGLAFRIESMINVLFEQSVEKINLDLITRATFFQIYDLLTLFYKALKIEGISSVELERQLDLLALALEIRGFTFTQYRDIFKGFAQAVKNIIHDYFHNLHEQNLNQIIAQIPVEHLLPKYLPKDPAAAGEKLQHRISEIFYRDQIALSLGLQQLDVLLSRILNTLFHQADQLPKDRLRLLLNYDPKRAMTTIDQINERLSGIIYLGNKGLNLVRLQKFGLPIPTGFIITTEIFRARDLIEHYRQAQEDFKEQVLKNIAILEHKTGKIFGDHQNSLLLSIRSGSSVSQPGMMDTFLNVGMNEKIAAGIGAQTDNAWFAWDNYRRFLQCYGMAFGLERDDFDAIINELKRRAGIAFKRHFTGPQMRKVAMTYKGLIKDSGFEIPEDPYDQLFLIIKMVFDSWESPRACAYRHIMGISDDWGTAVTVQEMVYGNTSRKSGTGVFFTHNPKWPGDSLRLWGDFSIGNQGEDVVSGLVNTLPISVIQQDIEMRETDITLETHFPEIYATMEKWANDLIYEKGWSPQEMEFTFESPQPTDLYLLQTRDMAIREHKQVLAFDLTEQNGEQLLGHGIGVSGGAMSGRVVFSLDEIEQWRHTEPETALILVRGDTVPDDIREIYAADGLLTARGGVTSHAAVVAHRLGKTGVVGCGDLICNEKDRTFEIKQMLIKSGEHISIDGHSGTVYLGLKKVKEG